MKINKNNIFSSLILVLIIFLMPRVVLAEVDVISMGGVAGNIHGSASILIRVMWAACIIVGIALIVAAIAQYQIHRRNPKLVPLTNPVMYLILALIALAIPFAQQIFDFEDPYDPVEQQMLMQHPTINIDR